MSGFGFHRLTVVACVLGATALHAQEKLNQEQLASHLMTWVPPVYPAAAQAAHIEGEVVAEIELGPDGLVRTARAISGPTMLRQTTSSALKLWRYQPFQHGNSTISVAGTVRISFSLTDKPSVHTPHESTANGSWSTVVTLPPRDNRGQPDEDIANKFDAVWNICSGGGIAHNTSTDVADACKKSAAISDTFPEDRRYIERREANVYAAIAFANVRDLQTALTYAGKAVDLVKLGHDTDSGAEAAYSIHGQLCAFSGDTKQGDEDLSKAEDFTRKGASRDVLKRDLQFHADLLDKMNRPKEAQTKRAEAATI